MSRSTKAVHPAPASTDADAEFTIDALARAGKSTVRNVRAYQDRGLLPPPMRRGRKGFYSRFHLARLCLIVSLLNRGFSLNNIAELVEAWQQGRELSEVLGLEAELTRPWSREVPTLVSATGLVRLLGSYRPSDLARAIELGIIKRDGLRFRIMSPRIVSVAAELMRVGVPMGDMLEIMSGLRSNVEKVAEQFIAAIVEALDLEGDQLLPAHGNVAELAALIGRLRAQVGDAVEAEASHAIERALHRFLGTRLSQVIDTLQHEPKIATGTRHQRHSTSRQPA
ncbi:MAG TPA: MerR family transcriptional regulator [Nevskiaceae bacterium]|nr:MerR family transcriptional regulator [Nevskiaceae bacterium]